MNRANRRHRTHIRRFSPLTASRSFIFTLFCLITFSLQSYVAATHMHDVLGSDAGTAQLASADAGSKTLTADTKSAPASDHNRVPAHDNDCPLCRVMVHAGSFLFPTFLIIDLPDDGIVLAQSASVSVPTTEPVSHSWQSRGPPQH